MMEKEGTVLDMQGLELGRKSLVAAISFHNLVHEEDVEDLAQETLLRAATYISSYRGQSRYNFLLVIARRIAIDWHRAKERRREMSIGALPQDDDCLWDHPHSRPEAVVERAVIWSGWEKALEGFTDKQRVAAVCVLKEGLDYDTAARMAGYSINSMKSSISRSRTQIQKRMLEYIGGSLG